MPNTRPPAVTEAAWREKLGAIEGRSFVDYALYMGLSEGALIARLGHVTGLFKLYTASTTGDLLVGDPRSWAPLLATVAEAGGRVVVHAEDQSAIDRARTSERGLHGHDGSRPATGEAAAVRQACQAAATTGAPGRVHIAHVSCQQALEALAGLGCSAEVTPHHLFLDRRMEDLGAFGKVNPPLRTDADRAALWEALSDGRVPVLASDHAPHTREEKQLAFEAAPAGIPGVETMVPMAMAQVRHGRIALERLVDACATRPAAFLGVGPRALEAGAAAHVAVYDLHDEDEVTADMLHQRCGWTPYEGMTAVFPRLVVGPGGILVDDGEFHQGRPLGRYVGLDLERLRSL
jgi:dihydroorotase